MYSPLLSSPVSGYMRIGYGTDIHRLTAGDGLVLGGVAVPCAYRCEAVSDGDVLLHALVDALLGACCLGDIGEYYPPSRATPGEDSRRFVRETLALMAERGGRVENADCVVDLEIVRLADKKGAIRESVAALLGVGAERINIKAKTAEGLGPVGEGRAVAAQAAVLVSFSGGEGGGDGQASGSR